MRSASRAGKLLGRLRAGFLAMAMATVAGPVHASLTGTDVVVPSSASSSGAYGSQWVTTLWLTNRTSSPVTARLSFLQRDVSNTSPVTREELLGAGESRRYDDVVGTFFGLRDVAGAIRIRATGEVLAVSRTFNDVGGVMKDSLGTSLDALPAGMAIGGDGRRRSWARRPTGAERFGTTSASWRSMGSRRRCVWPFEAGADRLSEPQWCHCGRWR
ncbi:MAG: hypothetical protein IPN83_26770 [Holophagales bacterium]|nr:hypothetical protein [Holophagales bacterium]